MSSSGGGGVLSLEQAATNTTKSKSPMGKKRFTAAKVAFLATSTKKAGIIRSVHLPNINALSTIRCINRRHILCEGLTVDEPAVDVVRSA